MNPLSTIAPVALVIALGARLRARGHYAEAFFRDASRLTYWIGLPALLFREVAATPLRESWAGRLVAVLMLATLATGLAAGWMARMLRLSPARAGALITASFRGNIAYAGLPILLFALGAAAPGGRPWAAIASLCLGPMVVLYTVACVLLCAALTHGRGVGARALLRDVAGNPLILACAAGMAFSFGGLPLPTAAARTLKIVGDLALPLALLGLGATLDRPQLRRARAPAATAALMKVIFCPVAGWALARWMGLGPEETLIALIYLATPSAISLFVMSAPLGIDEQVTGAAIMLSTLLSAASLVLVLALFGPT